MSSINAINVATPVFYPEAMSSAADAGTDLTFSSVLVDALGEEDSEAAVSAPDEQTGWDTSTDISEAPQAAQTTDYSSLIANSLREEAMRMSIATGNSLSGMPGDLASTSTGGIEELILAAASSGEISDAQVALFMLCMMMQTDQSGDFSMMMQMMSSMLTKIDGDKEELRQDVMLSDYDPYVLDSIDKNVFKTSMPDGGTGQTVLPVECWKPTAPAVTSDVHNRSPERYRAVIDQFRVETARRYKPGENTFCNIFVWDVTSAMGAEVPHYVNTATGEPRYYPDINGATGMGAIATDKWLAEYGALYGWFETDAVTAQRFANLGKPAITSAGKLGHLQIVSPSKDGQYNDSLGVAISQAGRIVSNYTYLSNIYGNSGQKSVRYWVHD